MQVQDPAAESLLPEVPAIEPVPAGAAGPTAPVGAALEDSSDSFVLPVGASLIAAGLVTAAAGWMVGGIFRGWAPRPLGMLAALLGVGLVYGGHRIGRTAVMMMVALPLALAAGFAAALPGLGGVTIPEAVTVAVSSGGLLQPPVAFDPGWRFLMVPMLALLGAATGGLVASGLRPRLTVMLPLPLILGAALVQAPDQELISAGVALALVVGALMVLAGAEIRSRTDVSRGFEFRRAARGGAGVAAVLVALVVLDHAGFLFPAPVRSRAAEPQRPQSVALNQVRDRAIFTVRSKLKGPWRVGVLDVYRDNAFLLPPYDTSRFVTLDSAGHVMTARHPVESVTFQMEDAQSHALPDFGDPVAIRVPNADRVSYDPRTQTARMLDFVPTRGYRYTIEAETAPTGEQLGASGPPTQAMAGFLGAPAIPSTVRALIDSAPTNPWERLQFVRAKFYANVVASGAGRPVDVPPGRVAAMLAGGEGTPYEITAAEVMLARWSGIPARLAFGYYGGQDVPAGHEIHPRDGANWLEVWFNGYGWVSVFGVPPQAKATLSDSQHNRNVEVRPSRDINVEAYVPIQLENPLYLYEVVQYWLAVSAGPLALLVLALVFFPVPLKWLRGRRRRRWARSRSLGDQLAVEYAELRDLALDLGAPGRDDTPLEFGERVDADAEHAELAWLTTRALWGDLARDLVSEDVVAARELSRSVRRRLFAAQPFSTRLVALASRASLREPYDPTMPNLWPGRWSRSQRVAVVPRAYAGVSGHKAAKAAGLAAGLLALLAFSACGSDAGAAFGGGQLPDRLVPANLAGLQSVEEYSVEPTYTHSSARSLVSRGRIFSLRGEGVVRGVLQVEAFKPGFDTQLIDFRRGVRNGIGNGHFQWRKLLGHWVGEQVTPDERVYLWFSERTPAFEVLTVKNDVGQPLDLVRAVIQYQGTTL